MLGEADPDESQVGIVELRVFKKTSARMLVPQSRHCSGEVPTDRGSSSTVRVTPWTFSKSWLAGWTDG